MQKALKVLICAVGMLAAVSGTLYAAEQVLFGFEKDVSGWEIPDWALEKEDYVSKDIAVSTEFADEGKQSLKVNTKFPGGKWTAAYVEIQQFFDWTAYASVSADVYIPETAPAGLKGKVILTARESWDWIEMTRSVALQPGKWTTITANLLPGSSDLRTSVDDELRKDVRKFGVRIESNMKPVYEGPVYIDNIKLIEK